MVMDLFLFSCLNTFTVILFVSVISHLAKACVFFLCICAVLCAFFFILLFPFCAYTFEMNVHACARCWVITLTGGLTSYVVFVGCRVQLQFTRIKSQVRTRSVCAYGRARLLLLDFLRKTQGKSNNINHNNNINSDNNVRGKWKIYFLSLLLLFLSY